MGNTKTAKRKRTMLRRLIEVDGHLCPYCTRTMDKSNKRLKPTSDHIKAKSKIQLEDLNKRNRLIVCSQCNCMKADMTLEQFIIALGKKNEELLQQVDVNISRMRNIRYLLDIGLEE